MFKIKINKLHNFSSFSSHFIITKKNQFIKIYICRNLNEEAVNTW